MKITIGIILGLLIGYIASVTAAEVMRKYTCDDAKWVIYAFEVFPENGTPFKVDLGFCPDGVVLWRSLRAWN